MLLNGPTASSQLSWRIWKKIIRDQKFLSMHICRTPLIILAIQVPCNKNVFVIIFFQILQDSCEEAVGPFSNILHVSFSGRCLLDFLLGG